MHIKTFLFTCASVLSALSGDMQLAAEELVMSDCPTTAVPDLEEYRARAHALRAKGRHEQALQVYFEALAINPDFIDVQFGKDIGPWSMKSVSQVADLSLPQMTRWEKGEIIRGKKLLVHFAKGQGDTLQFARFLTQLIEEHQPEEVLFLPQDSLVSLFTQSSQLTHPRLTVVTLEQLRSNSIDFDSHIHLLALPHYLNCDATTIPYQWEYLKPPTTPSSPELATALEDALADPRLKVGLVWQGDPNHIHDKNRSTTLATLGSLQDIDGVSYYSLQVGPAGKGLHNDSQGWDTPPTDLGQYINSFADTALVMQTMDLILTIDTSSAHLSTATGRPTLILLPHQPDLRWAGTDQTNIWSKNSILLRQEHPEDWTAPLSKARALFQQRTTNP